jgi:hypothetical protein
MQERKNNGREKIMMQKREVIWGVLWLAWPSGFAVDDVSISFPDATISCPKMAILNINFRVWRRFNVFKAGWFAVGRLRYNNNIAIY